MKRPPSQPPELPGYEFVKLLGSGGFSDVFLYDQKLPRRRVAVKVLITEEITPASRAAFVAEANLMAQLSTHPYIVTIYQADVASDARPYFVMEYCSGPSLADRYKRERFSVEDALRTGVRLSSAVAAAHAAGILHRDIKPANVLGNDYGWPALTDFGISSAVDDEISLHTTTMSSALADTGTSGTGQSIGMSVPWSPPEMFEDDPQPDVRSDLFSLAATIYTILAGQTPFEVRGRSNGTADVIGRIERGAITPMERDDVPRSLIAVLNKGMASDRADRFASAIDFARALQRIELELGYAPTTMDVPSSLIETPDRGGDDADETRVRSVATIQAQPVAPPVFTPPPPSPSAESEPTVMRRPTTLDAQPAGEVSGETVVRRREEPAAEAAPASVDEPAPPMPRGRKIAIGVTAGVAVLVAAGVTLALVFGGPVTPAGTDPQSSPTAGPVVIASVPTPELVGATDDGSAVTFTVSNPDPEDSDLFLWELARTENETPHRVDGNSFTVPGYVAGQTMCVEVSVLRSGKTSPKPLETCYPQ